MIPAKSFTMPIAAALAAAAMALPAAAQPQALTPLDVTATRPTTVHVSIRGKDENAVRRDVRAAAKFVCGNAVGIHGLDLGDLGWCAERASLKAMTQYADIVRGRSLASSATIALSAR